MSILCFDIGGTFIKYSMMNNIDDYKNSSKIPTRIEKNTNFILEDIMKIIDFYKDQISVVAISTAGVVDSAAGSVIFAGPTIPNYSNTHFKKEIQKKYPCLEVVVENDVNAAAYGEYIYSAYDDTVFCLTIGTGVGGALIINNEIYAGFSKTAGEIGYLPFNQGYFQDFASTNYLLNYVNSTGYFPVSLNGEEIFELAKKGNKLCIEAINSMIDNLTQALVSIIYILNPKYIIIGGGISAQGEFLETKIKTAVQKSLISDIFSTRISLAILANNAALYGMYALAVKKNNIKNKN